MRFSLHFICSMLILAGMHLSCSRERLTESGDKSDFDLAQAEADMVSQLEYYNDLVALAAASDTTSALDSLVVLLEDDEDVVWATSIHTGVNIQWKSGLRGMITIRTHSDRIVPPTLSTSPTALPRRERAQGDQPTAMAEPKMSKSGNDIYTIPTSRKSLMLAICYQEFEAHDDTLIEGSRALLTRAGYDLSLIHI